MTRRRPEATVTDEEPLLPSRPAFRYFGRFVFAICVLVAVTRVSSLAARELQPTPVSLSQPLGWATSGAWSADGEKLLVVDLFRNGIVTVSCQGEVKIAVEKNLVAVSGGRRPALTRPATLRATGGGFLLEDEESDQISRLDRDLKWTDSIPGKSSPEGAGRAKVSLDAIFDWSPMGDGILAFGDFKVAEKKRHRAFLYFDDRGRSQVFYPVSADGEVSNDHGRRIMPYLASVGDVGYVLLFMGQRPTIGKVELGVDRIQELAFFPEGFRSRPRLRTRPEWASTGQGARQATHFYKAIEASAMAAGLYAWDQHLYLLAKEAAAENGETTWWLIKLDPNDEARELSRVLLPTKAAHLTVVPGELWALIEKGPVQGIGESHAPYMKTESMVLVPAGWLEDHGDSPRSRVSRAKVLQGTAQRSAVGSP